MNRLETCLFYAVAAAIVAVAAAVWLASANQFAN